MYVQALRWGIVPGPPAPHPPPWTDRGLHLMDKGYVVIFAMLAAYCLTGVVLYLRARQGKRAEG